MADIKLFDINPVEANPSLSKRIAFGDANSEGNITLQQLINLIGSNIGTDTPWTQLGVTSQYQAYSLNNMRDGIWYRKNKIGQLELDISVSCFIPGSSISVLCTLPEGFRPAYNKAFRVSDKLLKPRVLLAADVLYPQNGEISTSIKYKDRSLGSITVTRPEEGIYIVTHNYGSTAYRVLGSTLADGSVSLVETPMYFGRIEYHENYFKFSTANDASKDNSLVYFKMERFEEFSDGLGNYKIVVETNGNIYLNPQNEYSNEFFINQSLIIPLT